MEITINADREIVARIIGLLSRDILDEYEDVRAGDTGSETLDGLKAVYDKLVEVVNA